MDECEWWSGSSLILLFNSTSTFFFKKTKGFPKKKKLGDLGRGKTPKKHGWKVEREVQWSRTKTRWMPLWLVYHRNILEGEQKEEQWGFERSCLLYWKQCGCRPRRSNEAMDVYSRLWWATNVHELNWTHSNNVHEYLKKKKKCRNRSMPSEDWLWGEHILSTCQTGPLIEPIYM